jgi:hypothetical protein
MANMKISRIRAFALAACMTGSLNAQSVGGPIMGYVLEKSVGVRPLRGMPGAATLGSSVAGDPGYSAVAFAQQREYALGITRNGGQAVLLRNLGQQPRTVLLDLPPGADRIATSPAGDAAAFYYPGSSTVRVVTGLPGSPAISWNVAAPELTGGAAALAVSDGGGAVLFAAGAQVYLLAPELGVRYLIGIGGSPGLAFLAGSLDAVVADGVLSRVMLVRDPKGDAQVSLIGDAAQGVSQPVAVAAAPDNRRVFAANAEPGGVVSLSLAGEDSALLPCACVPTGLERLSGNLAFRLTEAGGGPVWILDGASSPPRIVFVPDQAAPAPVVTPRLPVRQPVRNSSAPRASER